MCTLSVIPNRDGYLLAMNRDERISRHSKALPRPLASGSMTLIYPRDVEGGTWVAVSERRTSLALLNWNAEPRPGRPPLQKARSRGLIIPDLIGCSSLDHIRAKLATMSLEGILPFRLVGVFPNQRQIWEWRWDVARLDAAQHPWRCGHWFSSSLSDERALRMRGAACQQAAAEPDAGSVPWLRRLHRSHTNGPGPFSICVHRIDVATLSYTEIVCSGERFDLSHFPESPCLRRFDTLLVNPFKRARSEHRHSLMVDGQELRKGESADRSKSHWSDVSRAAGD